MDDNKQKNSDRAYYSLALRIASDFGVSIAVPVVVLVVLGRKLDAIYKSGIIFTLVGFVMAALISGLIIYRKAKKYGKEYQLLVDKNIK